LGLASPRTAAPAVTTAVLMMKCLRFIVIVAPAVLLTDGLPDDGAAIDVRLGTELTRVLGLHDTTTESLPATVGREDITPHGLGA
jgi:hypothetical protein